MDYDPIQRTWPERRIHSIRSDPARLLVHSESGKVEMGLGDFLYPQQEEIMRMLDGRMPVNPPELMQTPFGQRLSVFWTQMATFPNAYREFMLEQDCRYSWHTLWWEQEGHRIYLLDETTALALLYTKQDDFPTELLRLPARSFFLRVPDSLGWRCDLPDDWAGSYGFQSRASTSDNKQPLDGFLITGEYEDDRLIRLHVLVGGRSAVNPSGDNTHWFVLDLVGYRTLGEVVGQAMHMAEGVKAEYVNREAMRIILGTVLYITSAHPELRPLPPHPKPLVNPKKKKHRHVHAQYTNQSSYRVVLVGGPNQGFRERKAQPEVTDLKRKPPKPHKRDGHYRWQPIGPRQEHQTKHIWIQPIQIGKWDRVIAYESMKNMQMIIRKTRPADLAVVK